MRANVLNYIAAILFFAAAIRGWAFPGVFARAHHASSAGEAVIYLVMGFTCIAAGATRSHREA